jgi:hypothetical protein
MRRREYHARRASSIKRFLPSSDAQTPAITAFETGKVELGNRRSEIVAGHRTEMKELLGHHRAHGVQPVITRTGAAVAVAIEAGARLATAAFESAAKDIRGISHVVILHLLPVPHFSMRAKFCCKIDDSIEVLGTASSADVLGLFGVAYSKARSFGINRS